MPEDTAKAALNINPIIKKKKYKTQENTVKHLQHESPLFKHIAVDPNKARNENNANTPYTM